MSVTCSLSLSLSLAHCCRMPSPLAAVTHLLLFVWQKLNKHRNEAPCRKPINTELIKPGTVKIIAQTYISLTLNRLLWLVEPGLLYDVFVSAWCSMNAHLFVVDKQNKCFVRAVSRLCWGFPVARSPWKHKGGKINKCAGVQANSTHTCTNTSDVWPIL